ncbi:hypothetical protein MKX03_021096 [Papaver bracteatum]|nr:hypothetical protein MKX03_021096 [Papaver bracteatum]
MVSFVSCFDRKYLYYAEYYEDYKMNPRKEHYSTKRISLKFLEGDVRLVGSCNGLICLSVERSYDKPDSSTYNDGYEESFYICNLIIGEVVNLPGMCISNRRKTVHGFGYHPLTNEYKVLRISYYGYGSINEPPYKGQVEVYTLGSGSGWRSKGEIKYHVWPNIHGGSVCVNGALHWLQEGSEEIVAFDLADEKFYLLQAPPNGRQEPFSRRLGVFRGCLVLVNEFLELGINPWHLWFLKKDNSIYNTREFYTKDPCWSQEYAILLRSMKTFPYLFAISEEGQVLLMGRFGYVVRYNLLESQTSDDIWEFDEHKRSWELPIPHRNTFVSLRALGEENVGTFTAGGELKFPNSGKKKYGVIKIVPPTTSETYARF